MRVLQNPAHLVRMRPARRRSPRPTRRRPRTTCMASIAAAANACAPCERAQPLMPRLWHSSQVPSRSLRARSQSLDGTRAPRQLPAFTTTMLQHQDRIAAAERLKLIRSAPGIGVAMRRSWVWYSPLRISSPRSRSMMNGGPAQQRPGVWRTTTTRRGWSRCTALRSQALELTSND